jgi:hypothetical protein
MRRCAISPFALAILFSIAVPARATITISFGNWEIEPEASLEIPILITTDSADELAAIDLYVTVEDGNTGPAPFATAIRMIFHPSLADPIFGAVSSQMVGYDDPWEVFPGDSGGNGGSSTGLKPAYAALANASSGPDADVPASGVLAYMTFGTAGVPAGEYDVGFENPDLGFTVMADIAGVLEMNVDYFLVPGTITVVLEPSSIGLCVFAPAGLAAAAGRYRKRRSRPPRNSP